MMNITPQLQAQYRAQGKALYLRYIDKNPENGLLGVRILDCKQMLEGAEAIAVFDRSTLTLTYRGWGNDQTVRLDGAEGHLMLEYIRAQQPCPLPDELWNEIPENAAGWAETGAISKTKHELVLFLNEARPDLFGPVSNTTTGQTSPDFYSVLLELFKQDKKQMDVTRAATLMFVRSLERAVIDAYTTANGVARAAAGFEAGSVMRKGLICKALSLCDVALHLRTLIEWHASNYPDIELTAYPMEMPAADCQRWRDELLEGAPARPDRAAAANERMKPFRPFSELERPTVDTPKDTGVAVIDPNHKFYRSMGYIIRAHQLPDDSAPSCVVQLLGQNTEYAFNYDQLGIIR